jgi:hypothetical protein
MGPWHRIRTSIVTAALMACAATRAEAAASPVAEASDTFAHARHEQLACLTCHLSKSGAMLTFEPPRGCQICHHQNPIKSECGRCHEPGSIPETLEIRLAIAAAGKPSRDRPVSFPHERHAELGCTTCHGQSVTLAPIDSAGSCRGCHADHHEAGRACSVCHRTESITPTHAPPIRAHVACDACHPTSAIAPLSPTRSFCLVCHDSGVDHYAGRECATCHVQARPEEYRSRLVRYGKGR